MVHLLIVTGIIVSPQQVTLLVLLHYIFPLLPSCFCAVLTRLLISGCGDSLLRIDTTALGTKPPLLGTAARLTLRWDTAGLSRLSNFSWKHVAWRYIKNHFVLSYLRRHSPRTIHARPARWMCFGRALGSIFKGITFWRILLIDVSHNYRTYWLSLITVVRKCMYASKYILISDSGLWISIWVRGSCPRVTISIRRHG